MRKTSVPCVVLCCVIHAGMLTIPPANALQHDDGSPGQPSPVMLERVLEQEWYELASNETNVLLGQTFRVFVNTSARNWISNRAKQPIKAQIIKLNQLKDQVTGGDKWGIATLELMQLEVSNSEPKWRFYSFGPMADAAQSAQLIPDRGCLTCHQRRNWRDAPVFFDFYLGEAPSFTKKRFSRSVTEGKNVIGLSTGQESQSRKK